MTDWGIESTLHPHVREERAELFHAKDGGSVEYEYLELLKALVLALKPTVLLETGCGPVSTIALAQAIKLNGFGHLVTVNHDLRAMMQTRRALTEQGLREFVDVKYTESLAYLRAAHESFDFAFLDSDLWIRAEELKILIDRKLVGKHCFAAIHDTSRLRDGGGDSAGFWSAFEKLQGVRWVEFPYSRGLVLAEVL